MRLIHFSDLHLGIDNYGLTDPETGLSTRVLDFLRVFDVIVDRAISERVDAVLFTGDPTRTPESWDVCVVLPEVLREVPGVRAATLSPADSRPKPAPLPERLIGGDPLFYLHKSLGGWGSQGLDHIEPQALADYERCFCMPETIHAACEDYRASAGIDLEHDRASRAAGDRIACDLLVLWGERGVVQRQFDPMALWRAQCAGKVSGWAMPAGHFIPEELPEETARALGEFFGG